MQEVVLALTSAPLNQTSENPWAEQSHFFHVPREERVCSIPPPWAAEKSLGNIFQDARRTNFSGASWPPLPPSRATPYSSDSAKKVSLILLNLSHCLIQVFEEGLGLPSQLSLCFWGPRPQCSQPSLNLTCPS